MNSYLRQSTASQSRAIGPFLDDTDFKTAETGLTIANTDIKLVANGGASVNKNAGGGTHRVNGEYGITFDATDTGTVGELKVSVAVAGALPVFHTFQVLEESVYDALFVASASARLGVDLANVGAPSGNSAKELGVLWRGTLAAISATSITLPVTGIDHEANLAVRVMDGTGAFGKARFLTYSGTGEVWNVDPAWNSDGETPPSGTVEVQIVNAEKPPTAAAMPNVNTTKVAGATQTAGDIVARLGAPAGASMSADIAAVKTDTGNLVSRITATLFTGITSLAQWLGIIAGKQTGNSTARTELRATGAGSGTFDEQTDSQEALRDRGDAAWLTATGFSTLDAPGVRTALGLAAANLDAQLDAMPTVTELATALAAADDATLAAIAAIFTTAMTETYAADGATMTLPQALYSMKALLSQFAISGTTMTTKRLDGTTTAEVYTMDSATTPTAITRTA